MKLDFRIFFVLMFTLSSLVIAFSDSKADWLKEEEKSKKLFKDGKYDEAIILFREIILSSEKESLKNEAYFWIAKAYMNNGKYKLAEANLEYYLSNFKSDGLNYPEAFYQKGRLLFLQEQYSQSVEQLNLFLKEYPNDPLVSNAYYWIGESLYATGQFEDSILVFNIVINKYPSSNKKEASVYKLRLIEHKKSELVLQNLLKWSYEQYISSLNQFKVKERSLNQAIDMYEKSGKTISTEDKQLIDSLRNENEELKAKIVNLEKNMNELSLGDASDDYNDRLRQLQLKEELLSQKEETLMLLEESLREKESSLEK